MYRFLGCSGCSIYAVLHNSKDIVPGDCLLLESEDLYVDEAMLSGETFPVEKTVNKSPGFYKPVNCNYEKIMI